MILGKIDNFDLHKSTSPPSIHPNFFLANLDTHTYQNQLKAACLKFFLRLDLKMTIFGILSVLDPPKNSLGAEIKVLPCPT